MFKQRIWIAVLRECKKKIEWTEVLDEKEIQRKDRTEKRGVTWNYPEPPVPLNRGTTLSSLARVIRRAHYFPRRVGRRAPSDSLALYEQVNSYLLFYFVIYARQRGWRFFFHFFCIHCGVQDNYSFMRVLIYPFSLVKFTHSYVHFY